MAAKVAKGSIRKSKPIVTKTSLNSPYEKVWTPVVGEDMQFILTTLIEKFTQVGLKKVEIKKKFIKHRKPKKDNSAGTDINQDVEEERTDKEEAVKPGWTLSDVRKHLAIGINEVTRALEKNEVNLVIVCKSAKPPMITTHLTELSASRGVTACQLPRLSKNVAPVLGLKSLLALGFKKSSDIFVEEVKAIVPRVPPVNVAWLASEPERTEEDTANENNGTSRKRKLPTAEEAGGVQLQSLRVKKIVPNPNRKRKERVKKGASKK